MGSDKAVSPAKLEGVGRPEELDPGVADRVLLVTGGGSGGAGSNGGLVV